jgi:diketogulonate reductase-like aldo/keto reductase
MKHQNIFSQAKGKIKAVAVTNLDTKHLEEIVSAGVKIAANQVSLQHDLFLELV